MDENKALVDLVSHMIREKRTDILYMIIAECISSDTNYTIEDANKHIETLEAIVAAFNSEEELPEELEKLKPQLEGFIKNGPKALIDPEDFFGAEE